MYATQVLQQLGLFCAAVAGAVWGVTLARRTASGQAGVALALVPLAGSYLSMAYC
jgi:hypothetical protein